MKKLTLLLTAITLTFTIPAYAETVEKNAKIEQAVQFGDVHVSVNGLVCDFCARALEKVFGKEEAVNAIDVNLDTKMITVNFNEGQTLSDEKLTQLITDAGYNVEGIHRVE
jgi:copper chaperone CopZ